MDELDSLLAELEAARPITSNNNDNQDSLQNESNIEYPPPKSYQLIQSYQEQTGKQEPTSLQDQARIDNDTSQTDASKTTEISELDKLLEELEQEKNTDLQQDLNNVKKAQNKIRESMEAVSLNKDKTDSENVISKDKGDDSSLTSATKELDDLMESLTMLKTESTDNSESMNIGKDLPHSSEIVDDNDSNTNVKKNISHAADNAKKLDTLMGGLQSDLNKQGITVESKGMCAGCHRMIVGQILTALDQSWHPQHFICAECETSLANKTFYEWESKPYCERDYFDLFAPKCAGCNEPITAECLTAMDQKWHPEHFICVVCEKPLVDEKFHVIEDKPYCSNDFYELHAPTCSACNRKIIDEFVSALNCQWHPKCFVCMQCKKPFADGVFMSYEGLPYCKLHYYTKIGSICCHCEEPIAGRCIIVAKRKYHPEHFLCSFCQKQLSKGTFKERSDKPYCVPCYAKLFG